MITRDDANNLQNALKEIAPVVNVRYDALGSSFRASLYIMISLDPKDSWANGILENSRYIRVSVTETSWINRKKEVVAGYELEHFSGSFTMLKGKGFRKTKVEKFEQIADVLKTYVAKFPRFEQITDEVTAAGGTNAWQTLERKAAGQFLPWEK